MGATSPSRRRESEFEVRADLPDTIEDFAKLLVRLLFRFWKLWLVVSLISAGLAWTQAEFFLPRKYKASAVLMPRGSRGSDSLSTKAGAILAALGTTASSATQDVQQLQAYLKSSRLRSKTLEDLHIKYPDRSTSELSKISGLDLSLTGLVFTLSAWGTTPEIAYDFLQTSLASLQKIMSENQIKQSERAVEFIDARIGDVKKSLFEIESSLGRLRSGDRSANLVAPQGLSLESQINYAKREFQVQAALLETLTQQRELAQIDSKREEQMFILVDPPVKSGSPIYPRPKTNAFYGFFYGLFASWALIVILFRGNKLRWISRFESH